MFSDCFYINKYCTRLVWKCFCFVYVFDTLLYLWDKIEAKMISTIFASI